MYKVTIKNWSATIYAWCLDNLKGYHFWEENNTCIIDNLEDYLNFTKTWYNDIINE